MLKGSEFCHKWEDKLCCISWRGHSPTALLLWWKLLWVSFQKQARYAQNPSLSADMVLSDDRYYNVLCSVRGSYSTCIIQQKNGVKYLRFKKVSRRVMLWTLGEEGRVVWSWRSHKWVSLRHCMINILLNLFISHFLLERSTDAK